MVLEKSGLALAGPPGYCVDRSSVRERDEGIFALLGSCASVSGRANQPKPHSPGLISISLGPALSLQESVTGEMLASFVKSDRGSAAIAADRPVSHFRTLETRQQGAVSFVFVEDGTIHPDSGLEKTHWRAVFFVGDRIATSSIYSYANAPMSKAAGLAALSAFSQRMKTENRSAG